MSKDPSKIKRCPECKTMAEAATMRPVARTQTGGVQRVCLDCYARLMALRKLYRSAAENG